MDCEIEIVECNTHVGHDTAIKVAVIACEVSQQHSTTSGFLVGSAVQESRRWWLGLQIQMDGPTI